MPQKEPTPPVSTPMKDTATIKRVRSPVALPSGSQKEQLGSGIITRLLGVGGMANVYEIWNSHLEVNRAVKLLHPNYTEETKQRFDTEIKITAKLHHANIVEVHNVGYWNDLPYIEMERIDGKTLETLIQERGAFPTEVCTAIGIMIGRALRYAHHQEYVIYGKNYHGVIHRDLKPSNIMISTRGILKLMDFGIARPTDTSIHTTDGSILGTMQYLSPEQLEGKEPDVRTDIYSLGTVLYEMITGEKAFPEKNAAHLMVSRLKNDFKSLDCYDLKIPFKLKNLIHRCMIKDREKRIQDASSFLSEVTKIHKSLTSLTPEQEVKQFIGAKDISKRVLATRYRLPIVWFGSIAVMAMLILVLYFNRSMVTNLFNSEQAETAQILTEQMASVSAPDFAEPDLEPAKIVVSTPKMAHVPALPNKVQKETAIEVVKEEVQQVSLVDKLMSLYGTTNLSAIFIEEVKIRRYKEAVEIYAQLSADEIKASKVIIYRMRMLRETGNKSALNQLLMEHDVQDAEFYLEKARLFLDNGNTAQALKFLETASQSPVSFIENNVIRLERLYLKAKCKSLEFDGKPTIELKNQALESWYELKAELQTSKDHNYFKEADLQMQRITEKMNLSKG